MKASSWPVLLLAGCSARPAPPPSPNGPHALWSADPASLANPFPDARLAGPDGGFGLRADFWQPFVTSQDLAQGGEALTGYLQGLGAAAASVTGFGNYGAQLVPFSAAVDESSLAAAFAFVRLSAPPVVEPPPRVSWQGDLQFAQVRPAAPLLPATPYALVLTSGATAGGQPLSRSVDFDTWARGSGAPAVASLAAALGVGAAQIVFASLFTTEDVRADLQSLAGWVAQPLDGGPSLTVAAAPVTSCTPGASAATEQCPEGVFPAGAATRSLFAPWLSSEGWEDPPNDVGTIVVGDVALQDVRDGEDGHFVPASVASPGGARTVPRQFVLATPDPGKHPMPAAGWPMVIAAHGLGGGNSVHLAADGTPMSSFCLALAEFLARNGYGCLGIDAPSHQSRGSFVSYFDMQDLAVTRDYLREMIFDEMQLDRMLASWPAGLDGVTLDPSRIAYLGQSLGSVEGTTLLTLDPRTRGGVLLVPGGGLTEVVQSPVLGGEVGLLLAGYTALNYEQADGGLDPELTSLFPLVDAIGQAVVESGDPINHARYLPATVHALIDEGLQDTIMPNPTTDALAAALGFPTLSATVQNAAGVDGLWKWNLADYGLDPSVDQPHSLFGYLPAARAQAATYLASFETEIAAP